MEDVDHIRQTCAVENMVVFVDSSLRDRQAHATPAEYVVNFQQPFINVMGVEVLDAAIPRTMYVVDQHNNAIRLIQDDDSLDLHLAPGDYGMSELVVQLQRLFAPFGVRVTSQSVDVKTTSLLRFASDRPFWLDMDASTAREVLGFDEYARTPPHAGLYVDRNDRPGGGRMYGSVRVDDAANAMVVEFDEQPSETATQTLSPFGAVHGARIELDLSHRLGASADPARAYRVDVIALPLFYRGAGAMDAAIGPLDRGLVRVEYSGDGRPLEYTARVVTAAGFDASMRDRGFPTLAHPTLLLEDGARITPLLFLVVEPAPADDPRAELRQLRLPDSVSLSMELSPGAADRYEGLELLLQPFGQEALFAPSAVLTTPHAYALHAPGMISLVGERYVILRCKEIDENAQIGYAYMSTSPGLALFKLGVMGYADIRLDFSSIRYKEFHPIGKLSRLTLRFETLSGGAYDFKGVNHHMLLVIKYYVPRMEPRAPRALRAPPTATRRIADGSSRLNPSYDPDVGRYWCDNQGATDSDDDSLDGDSSDDNRYDGI